MKRSLVTLFLLALGYLSFAQSELDQIKVKTMIGTESPLKEVTTGDPGQRVILYIYADDCSHCKTTVNMLIENNYSIFNEYGGYVEMKTIYVSYNDDKDEWLPKLKKTIRKWSLRSYYHDQEELPDLRETNALLVLAYLNGELINEHLFADNFQERLRTILEAHPLIDYKSEYGETTSQEKAEYVTSTNIFPSKLEKATRVFSNGEPGVLASVQNEERNGQPVSGIEIEPSQGRGIEIGYYKNGDLAEEYDQAEPIVRNEYLDTNRQKIEQKRAATYIRTTDLFRPRSASANESTNQITLFRRVTVRDIHGNLYSYRLYKGYEDQLLETYDYKVNEYGDGLYKKLEIQSPSSPVTFEIPEDEEEIEEVVIELDITETEETEIEEIIVYEEESGSSESNNGIYVDYEKLKSYLFADYSLTFLKRATESHGKQQQALAFMESLDKYSTFKSDYKGAEIFAQCILIRKEVDEHQEEIKRQKRILDEEKRLYDFSTGDKKEKHRLNYNAALKRHTRSVDKSNEAIKGFNSCLDRESDKMNTLYEKIDSQKKELSKFYREQAKK